MTSSPSRDRWTPIIAAANRNSAAKSRSATRVDRVGDRPGEAELRGDRLRVEPQRGAGQRAGAVAARTPCGRPSRAAGRRRAARRGRAASWWPNSTGWACCRWVMPGTAESTWRSAWSTSASCRSSTPRRRARASVAQVEPEVGGHLVVAAAPGAQPAAERSRAARSGRAPARRARPRRPASARRRRRRHPRSSPSRAVQHLRELVVVEQPGPVQHAGVRPRRGEVVRRQPPVEVHRHATARPARRPGRPRTGRPTAAASRARSVHVSPSAGRGRAASRLRQAPQLHEALGQRLVEGVAGVVGGQVEVVQRLLAAAAVDRRPPAVQHHPDVAGDVLAGSRRRRRRGRT